MKNTTKRQRHVFPTGEIAHLWAHQTQDSARNPHGNFYFNGPTIYSYGSHFPVATIVKNRKGEKAFLMTTRGYSSTTAKHVWDVRSAIPHEATRFDVSLDGYMIPHNTGGKLIAPESDRIIEKSYHAKIAALVDAAKCARVGKTIQRHLDAATAERNALLAFVEFFGLPKLSAKARIASRKLPFIPASVDEAKVLGRAAKIEAAKIAKEDKARRDAAELKAAQVWIAAHPEYAPRWDGTAENANDLYLEHKAAETAKADLRRLTEWMEDHADVKAQWDGTLDHGKTLKSVWLDEDEARRKVEAIAAWRDGTKSYVPYNTPTMLRVNGDVVETSMGAQFPVDHARQGLALVRSVKARGEEWKANGHTCHLGHYVIDKITADGTVFAGCHVVEWPEIERIAPAIEMAGAA